MKSTIRSTLPGIRMVRAAGAKGRGRAAVPRIVMSLAALAVLVTLPGCASKNMTAEESVVVGIENSEGLEKMAADDVKSKKRRGKPATVESPGSGGH